MVGSFLMLGNLGVRVSEMAEFSSEKSEMSAGVEAMNLMRAIAEPAPAGAHIETLIRSVARKVGLTFSRGKAIWYGEARIIRAEEMDSLRAVARKTRSNEVELTSAYQSFVHEYEQRLARLEAALVQMVQD